GSSGKAGVEVVARDDCATGELRAVIENHGRGSVDVVVRDGYTSRQTSYHLRAGQRVTYVASGDHHWYDLSVTVAGDPVFLRHLAGHVETGRPSTSDPALA